MQHPGSLGPARPSPLIVAAFALLLSTGGCATVRSIPAPEIAYTHWSLGVAPPLASPLRYVEINARDLPEPSDRRRHHALSYGSRIWMGRGSEAAQGAMLMQFFTPGYHRRSAGGGYWGLESGPGIGYLSYDPRYRMGGARPRLGLAQVLDVYTGRPVTTFAGTFFVEAGVNVLALDLTREPSFHVRPLVRVGRVIR